MNLTDKEVRYVADLANLRLTDEEVGRMSHDLGQILTHIEQLNELDTTDVEPMAQVLFGEDESRLSAKTCRILRLVMKMRLQMQLRAVPAISKCPG